MDLVRKQSNLARGNVVALVRVCGNWFALRRVGGALEVKRLTRPEHQAASPSSSMKSRASSVRPRDSASRTSDV